MWHHSPVANADVFLSAGNGRCRVRTGQRYWGITLQEHRGNSITPTIHVFNSHRPKTSWSPQKLFTRTASPMRVAPTTSLIILWPHRHVNLTTTCTSIRFQCAICFHTPPDMYSFSLMQIGSHEWHRREIHTAHGGMARRSFSTIHGRFWYRKRAKSMDFC